MQYSRAVDYLFSFLNFEVLPFQYQREFNLARMRQLLDWFGHAEKSFAAVLVAGTKGKGSTANFLASLLSANGYRTGLYTSPHLSDPRERIRVDGRAISKRDLAGLAARIRPVIERRKKENDPYGPITFFEMFTLLAILYFDERKVSIGIFEAGMGGRLDATNVLTPLVSVITPISFDHEEHLGRTLTSIAREKAAIIKPRGTVVSAKQPPEAREVIEREVRRKHARAFFWGHEFQTKHESISKNGGVFDFMMLKQKSLPPSRGKVRMGGKCDSDPPPLSSPTRGEENKLGHLHIRLPGRFQIQNAAAALAASYLLEARFGFPLSEKAIRAGLEKTFWPGRFELVRSGKRTYVLDGAHNGASMNEVREAFRVLFPKQKAVVILGVSREKNLKAILEPIADLAGFVIATKSHNPRAQEPKVILEELHEMGFKRPRAWACGLKEALELARRSRNTDGRTILITGSLFLAGEARKLLKCPTFI